MLFLPQRILLKLLGVAFTIQLLKVSVVLSKTCVILYLNETNQIPNCSDIVVRNLEVPGEESLLLNLQDGATVTFEGVTTFGNAYWDGPLIEVTGNRITVQGSEDSYIDGKGAFYWDGGAKNPPNVSKPIFFHITVTDSVFDGIHLVNCPMHCTHIEHTNDTVFMNWNINNTDGLAGNAPVGKQEHNTDGFFIYISHNLLVTHSRVINEDDCAVIRSGSNITVSNLHCTGSHGLSLSVGDSATSLIENTVVNVTFQDSIVDKAGTAIHIKTHNEGGPGKITGATYRNISFSGITDYGINIQQNYPNKEVPKGNVPITDLTFIDVKGTVAGKKSMGVYIICADEACANWIWAGVNVTGGHKANSCNFKPNGYIC